MKHRTRTFLLCAAMASGLGVFLSATRIGMIAMVVIVLASNLTGRMGLTARVVWVSVIASTAFLISTQERLFQRLLTLTPDFIMERLSWSINWTLTYYMWGYPLGNGLGGGGTSIPFFLQHLLRNPLRTIENSYGTILLEQGVPGLAIWLAFLAWVFTRRTTPREDPWYAGRKLARIMAAMYFTLALIGQGLLTSVPNSPLLLLLVGWIVVRQEGQAKAQVASSEPWYLPPLRPMPSRASLQTASRASLEPVRSES